MRISARRGMILLSVLGLTTVILILLTTGTAFMREQSRAGSGTELRVRARYAAEAGLQMALEELTTDSNWGSGATPYEQMLDISEDAKIQAKIEVWANSTGSAPISGPGGVSVPPGKAYLVSTGVIHGREYGGALGSAKSIVSRPIPEVNFALQDRGYLRRLSVGDAWIDAFDSNIESPIDPTVYLWDTAQPNQPPTTSPYGGRGGAKIKSASIARIESPYYGDIFLPTGETCTAPQHYGNIVRDDDPIPAAKYVIPDALDSSALLTPILPTLSPGKYGVVNIPNGSNLFLERGEYVFRELNLGDNCTIELTDNPGLPYQPTVLYIEDKFTVGRDGLVNMTNSGQETQAKQLQIFGTDRVEFDSYGGNGNRVGTVFDIKNGSRIRACIGSYMAFFKFDSPSGLSAATPNNTEASGRMGIDIFGGAFGVQIEDKPGVRFHYDKALEGQILDGQTKWVLENSANN